MASASVGKHNNDISWKKPNRMLRICGMCQGFSRLNHGKEATAWRKHICCILLWWRVEIYFCTRFHCQDRCLAEFGFVSKVDLMHWLANCMNNQNDHIFVTWRGRQVASNYHKYTHGTSCVHLQDRTMEVLVKTGEFQEWTAVVHFDFKVTVSWKLKRFLLEKESPKLTGYWQVLWEHFQNLILFFFWKKLGIPWPRSWFLNPQWWIGSLQPHQSHDMFES